MPKEIPISREVKNLIDQLGSSREDLKKYLEEVAGVQRQVEKIFPEKLDYRSKFMLEDKVKAATQFYSTLLSIRQEINRTITQEIQIRHRLEGKSKDDELDVREIAEAFYKMKKTALEETGSKELAMVNPEQKTGTDQ